jgi:hypothetical protein
VLGAKGVYISLRIVQVQMGYFAVLRVAKWANIYYVCEERMSFIVIALRYRRHLSVAILTGKETTLHHFLLQYVINFYAC